jgi:YHS domain-containing protein
MRNTLKQLLIVTLVCWSANSMATDFVFTNDGFFGKGNEFAIEGYDTVAYFTENKPVKGSERFQTKYKEAVWLFKNAENLAAFKENPQKYAPQYGGHCAWRVGVDGKGVYGDPEIWTLRDGKLYLNYNDEVQYKWNKDIPGFIKKGNKFWIEKNNFNSLN